MNSTHIISQDVFDKIRSRFSNLEMGDENGGVTTDPKEARFFDFDFVVEERNLGRVSISINEIGALKLFYSQGILEGTDDFIHKLWYDFLREMRMFAKRRLLRFDTRDITKSNLNKDDFQYLASNGPKEEPTMNMSESIKFEGSKKTSYRVLEKTKLIAKHRNSIEDESAGARSRRNNIKALYIENSEGERFKYPFIHIAGAKAMQRHVANGGRPYDDMGNAIIKMSEQITQLTAFKRHVGRPDGMNQKVNEITSKTDMKLESLRRTVEGLCNQGYYEKWSESFVPNKGISEMDQATLEDYKNTFTVSSFREDLAQYFPLIHQVMQEAGEIELEDLVSEEQEEKCDECGMWESQCTCDDVKEGIFSKFIEWADRIEEGKLEPDTLMDLKDLLDQGLTLDVDGRSAIDALQGIGVHDEELESALQQLSKVNPSADPKDTILAWLAKDDPEAAKEFGYKSDAAAAKPEAEPEVAPEEPTGEEDVITDKETGVGEAPTPNVRDIAEMVYSFYDRTTGKIPKGPTGVVTHIRKEMGDEAAELAEKLVDHLMRRGGEKTEDAFSSSPVGPAAQAAINQGKSPSEVSAADSNDKFNQTIHNIWNNGTKESINQELESIMKLAGVPPVSEAVEDRTSYKVARYLFDKGLRYNPQNEKQIINKMDDAMIAMNMPAKTIQYLLRHDQDFISDVLGELQGMEQAVDELATGNPTPNDVDSTLEEGPMWDKVKAVGSKAVQAVGDAGKSVGKFFHKTAQHAVDEYMKEKYPGKVADTSAKKDAALGLYMIDKGILSREDLDKLKPMVAKHGGLFQVCTDLKCDFNLGSVRNPGKMLYDILYPQGFTKKDADGNVTSFRMPVSKAEDVQEGQQTNKDFDIIMKLAGLAK